MKKGFLDSGTGTPGERELELINKLSRRKLSAAEVFVFSVVLCDNEIDRDFERFSIDALHKLSELYVGKSGIFDHSMKGRDQLARIFECEVEQPEGRTTTAGEPYYRVKARAYMPRTPRNDEIILEIDAGIKKEVSVGLAVSESRCSVCGADRKQGSCAHQKGRIYQKEGDSAPCHHVLSNPTDAFEWSFVAVPAQREAGVIKAFSPPEKEEQMDIETVKKSLGSQQDVTLTAGESRALSEHIAKMESDAVSGRKYVSELRRELSRLFAVCQPNVPGDTAKSVISRMDTEELLAFKSAFEKNAGKILPQTAPKKAEGEVNSANSGFII